MPQLLSNFKTYWRQKYIVRMCVALNKPTAPDIGVYEYINISVIGRSHDTYSALIEAAKYICNVYPNAEIDWVDTDVVKVTDLGTASIPVFTEVESVYNYPPYERRYYHDT